MVLGALARPAVVAASHGERGLVEPIDRLSIGRGEGNVNRPSRFSLLESQVLASLWPEAEHAGLVLDHPAPPRSESGLVERPARREVTDGDRQVVDEHVAHRVTF